jgi:Transglutaminase-like superfamily
MAKWAKLLRLTKDKRQLLLKACLVLTSIRLGLYLLPFQLLMRVIGAACKADTQPTATSPNPVESVIWAVQGISRHLPGNPKCLAQALTTKVLLHQQGYVSKLQIGVAKSDNGSLEAHAWIEYEGRIVIGNLRDLSRFIPLPSVEGVKL